MLTQESPLCFIVLQGFLFALSLVQPVLLKPGSSLMVKYRNPKSQKEYYDRKANQQKVIMCLCKVYKFS